MKHFCNIEVALNNMIPCGTYFAGLFGLLITGTNLSNHKSSPIYAKHKNKYNIKSTSHVTCTVPYRVHRDTSTCITHIGIGFLSITKGLLYFATFPVSGSIVLFDIVTSNNERKHFIPGSGIIFSKI